MNNRMDYKASCDLYLPCVICSKDGFISNSRLLLWNYHKWFSKPLGEIDIGDMLDFINTMMISALSASLLCERYDAIVVALILCFITIIVHGPILSISHMFANSWRNIFEYTPTLETLSPSRAGDCIIEDTSDEECDKFLQGLNSQWQVLKTATQPSCPLHLTTFKAVWGNMLSDTCPKVDSTLCQFTMKQVRLSVHRALIARRKDETVRQSLHAHVIGANVELGNMSLSRSVANDPIAATEVRAASTDIEAGSVQGTYASIRSVDNLPNGSGVTLRSRLQQQHWRHPCSDCILPTWPVFRFFLDLLPYDARVILAIIRRADLPSGGDVYEPIYSDDHKKNNRVRTVLEGIGCAIVNGIFIIGVGVYLVLYFSNITKEIVIAWVISIVLWAVFTILFVEPLYILAIHYWLPLIVRNDVIEARSAVVRTLTRHELHSKMTAHPTGLAARFQTSIYMLLSCHIAAHVQNDDELSQLIAMYEPLCPLLYPLNSPRILRPFAVNIVHHLNTTARLCVSEYQHQSYTQEVDDHDRDENSVAHLDQEEVIVGRTHRSKSSQSSHANTSTSAVVPLPEHPVQTNNGPLCKPIAFPMERGYVQWRSARFFLSALIRSVWAIDAYLWARRSQWTQSERRVCIIVGSVMHVVVHLAIFFLLVVFVWVHVLLFRIHAATVVVPGVVGLAVIGAALCRYRVSETCDDDNVSRRDVCMCSQMKHSKLKEGITGLRHITQCGCPVCSILEKYEYDKGCGLCSFCEEKYFEKICTPADTGAMGGDEVSNESTFLSGVDKDTESAQCVDGGEEKSSDNNEPRQREIDADRQFALPEGLSLSSINGEDLNNWASPSDALPAHLHLVRAFTTLSDSSSDDSWSMSPAKLAATAGITHRSGGAGSHPGRVICPLSIDENTIPDIEPPRLISQTNSVPIQVGIAEVRQQAHPADMSGSCDSKQSYKKAISVRANYQSDSLARYQDMLLQRSVAKLQLRQRRSAGKQRFQQVDGTSDSDSAQSSANQSPRSSDRPSRKSDDALAAVKNRLIRSPKAGSERQRAHSADADLCLVDEEKEAWLKTREVHSEHMSSVVGLEEDMNKDKRRAKDSLAKRLSQKRNSPRTASMDSREV